MCNTTIKNRPSGRLFYCMTAVNAAADIRVSPLRKLSMDSGTCLQSYVFALAAFFFSCVSSDSTYPASTKNSSIERFSRMMSHFGAE